jgi:hypothetical protein
MKYRLLEDHQVRLSNKVIKAGVYTLEQLEKFHEDGSFSFCMKNTKLKSKLTPFIEEEVKPKKSKK